MHMHANHVCVIIVNMFRTYLGHRPSVPHIAQLTDASLESSCVVNENRQNLPQCMWMRLPYSLGIARCLINSMTHQHPSSRTTQDSRPPEAACTLIDYPIRGTAQDDGASFAGGHELDELTENNQGCNCVKRSVPCLH